MRRLNKGELSYLTKVSTIKGGERELPAFILLIITSLLLAFLFYLTFVKKVLLPASNLLVFLAIPTLAIAMKYLLVRICFCIGNSKCRLILLKGNFKVGLREGKRCFFINENEVILPGFWANSEGVMELDDTEVEAEVYAVDELYVLSFNRTSLISSKFES